MNMNQFTQKSLAAIQSAQDLAVEYGNQQIEQPHLLLALVGDGELLALLSDPQGLVPQLLTQLGITLPSLQAAVRAEVEKLPRVSGAGREMDKVYVAQDVDKALQKAQAAAQSMKDEYISVEHLFLGLLDAASRPLAELLRTYQINREKVLQRRGHQRQPGGNLRRPEQVRHRPGPAGTGQQAGPRHRPGRGNPQRYPHFVPEKQKQPRPDRRTRRG